MPLELTPAARVLLRVGDTALILAQRNAEWCGHAPVLEEDLALPNLALDQLGQARALLTHAGQALGLDEDQLAYLRDERQFCNAVLAELPHAPDNRQPGDFAFTVLRNALLSQWFLGVYGQWAAQAADTELAAIAAKALKECRYHWQHSADWVERLGDGTAESHRRMQAALNRAWPYLPELFAGEWAALQPAWAAQVEPLLARAKLVAPKDGQHIHQGFAGVHSEHLGHLLAEMQVLHRAHPGGVW
jgi:ring-1,2-phenylacetyl-CoA epoxidase subunit PaaC